MQQLHLDHTDTKVECCKMYMKHNFHFQTKGGQYSTDSFVKAVTELYKGQRQKRERAIQMVQDCGTYCKKLYKTHFTITLYFTMQQAYLVWKKGKYKNGPTSLCRLFAIFSKILVYFCNINNFRILLIQFTSNYIVHNVKLQ